ncbi:hypothetical protein ACFL96_05135 [Thermoproteota archaeon]
MTKPLEEICIWHNECSDKENILHKYVPGRECEGDDRRCSFYTNKLQMLTILYLTYLQSEYKHSS